MATKTINAEAKDLMETEPTTAVAVQTTQALGHLDTANVSIQDLQLPRLQVTYGVGPLSALFNPGDLILGGEDLLVTKGESITFIPLIVTKYWKEYMSKEKLDMKLMPRTFLTKDEVHADGGTTEWVGTGDTKVGPTFSEAIDIKMLIAQPEDTECGMFGIQLEGDDKLYAPAVFSMDKTAYKRAGRGFLTACSITLGNNLLSGRFELSAASKVVNNNNTVVPTIKITPKRNEAVTQKSIQTLFGG